MINTQTLVNFPVFGDNATKAQPDNAKYAAGFQPADVYPAEWVNWVWNKASGGVTALNTGVDMMEREINNVLDGADKTPDATKDNQLLEAIQKLIADAKAQAILAAHPIGSLYWSSQSTDPGTLFGGTWQRIKDKFILAAGDTYTNGDTGGAATVTLTTNNLPSHNHTIGGNTGKTQPTFTGSAVTSGAGSAHSHGLNSHKHSVGAHKHGLNSHKHSVGAHNHGLNSHKHTFAAAFGVTDGASGVASPSSGGTIVYGSNASLTTQSWTASDAKAAILAVQSSYTASDGTKKKKLSISGDSGAASGSTADSTSFDTGAATGDTANSTAFDTGAATGDTANESAHTHSVTAAGTVQNHQHSLPANTGDTGSGTAVNKMPPYLVKYCWERVS